jgi:hypothetical protein
MKECGKNKKQTLEILAEMKYGTQEQKAEKKRRQTDRRQGRRK